MSQLATKRGFDGTVHLSNGTTNYPLNDQSSFNSEELIALHWTGLVWSTCLKATIQAFLGKRAYKRCSKADVRAEFLTHGAHS